MKAHVEEVAKNHSIKIAIAEYADNRREVNDIMYRLPDEKGIGLLPGNLKSGWKRCSITAAANVSPQPYRCLPPIVQRVWQ